MIYTLTLNPSIDCVIHMDRFVPGLTNRTTGEEFYIGGKGINVSLILSELGIPSTALGFCAGFTGEEIVRELEKRRILTDFIRLPEGISRINIKLKSDLETEINCQGPHIPEEALEKKKKKTNVLRDGDTIVLAGSIPMTVSDNVYERILQGLRGKNIRIVVDASKKLLLNCLKEKPFLIKPNRQELEEIFAAAVTTPKEIQSCAQKLMKMGARNVIVSLGGDGAVLFAENGRVYHSGVVKEKVLNTVGAGDSMIGGFMAGFEATGDYEYAFRLGTACGNATAFSPGLANRDKIMDILTKLA